MPSCKLENILPILNDPAGLGARPLTIMNSSDTGPQLLFASPHRVIAGNFNVPGNSDSFDFFTLTKAEDALTILQKWNVDLVLLCRRIAPALMFNKNTLKNAAPTEKDRILGLISGDSNEPLLELLIRGQNPYPFALKPIEIPAPTDYLLFRVQLPKE